MNNEKRIRESKQRCSGKGTEEIYKPKWSLYSNLLFLKKACVQTESTSNLELEDYDSQVVTKVNVSKGTNDKVAHSLSKNMYFDRNSKVIINTIQLIEFLLQRNKIHSIQ